MPPADESGLVRRLRAGDQDAFALLVDRHHAPMLGIAMTFVNSRAVAEEVVQDTWLGMLRGLDRFEERSSLQTWLYRILENRARSTGVRERRSLAIPDPVEELDAGTFRPDGTWAEPPSPWTDDVDERLAAHSVAIRIRALIGELPAAQRQVVTLRDIDGLSSDDVCEVLGITAVNQRVLLHRARARIRRSLATEVGAWS
jgi:RNA polymerase sigma-70 factor (ECF subfamily)